MTQRLRIRFFSTMTTPERIREALQASRQNKEVRFIDSSEFGIDADNESHGDLGVRIIKRETTVTN